MAKPATSKDEQLIVKNRRATFDYDIDQRFEAGMVLRGSEVKAMRAGKVDVVDAYVQVERGEAWLKQLYVAPFEQAKSFPHDTRSSRKLLLHAKEIAEIDQALSREGATVIPMRLYFKNGRVKVELGMGRGKKHYDKRADIAKKDADREARVDARERMRR
jgi:SsrA-binding protein